MQRFIDAARAQPAMDELRLLLSRIVTDAPLHARLVNTLARMEYVGVRKMLKARHADLIDEEGLQHVIEEASHALRLKRAAIKLNGDTAAGIRGFGEEHTLAGGDAEEYLQRVDRACESLLAGSALGAAARSDANYLLSSAAIEVRADAFYSAYEICLREAGAPFSVGAILKDELRHLEEMRERLEHLFRGRWPKLMADAFRSESESFARWVAAVREAVAPRPASARG